MFRFYSVIVFMALVSWRAEAESMEALTQRVFDVAKHQYIMMDTHLDSISLPRTMDFGGNFVTSGISWWCSGFYPGSLWYIYEYTGSEEIRRIAERNTAKLKSLQYVTTDHDIGFQLNCSFGNGYRITGNEDYKTILCNGAQSLSTRFNPVAKVIRSWDFVMEGRDWNYPVIIDNMMNLEILMVASEILCDPGLRNVAEKHADTTMINHFRDDFTSWHLVDYDPIHGNVRKKETVQGYSDGSSWSRGQAWALYGYAMMGRMSGEKRYLDFAVSIGNMLEKQLPEDGIPFWDLDDSSVPKLRDSSAAAIMASAYLDLASQLNDNEIKKKFIDIAEKLLRKLASSDYLADFGDNGNFLLKHGVGNYPARSEIDVPLSYGDYYFLEGLLRFRGCRGI